MSDLRVVGKGIVADERGAIMVMGIFMCTCLVGALWYIAGIGDAVVYRERLQEAADATAMTTAVLHARGMNILVMLNLAMAAILAIRVALKVLQVALGFATIIVGGCALVPLPFNPAQPVCIIAEPLLAEADDIVATILEDVNPIIDEILEALNMAAKALVRIIPWTSGAGGVMLGEKYTPFIWHAGAVPPPHLLEEGLPARDGTTARLCSEAGTAVTDLLKEITPGVVRPVIGFVNPLFQEVLSEGGDYFCALGGSSSAPTFDSLTERQAKKRCNMELDEKVDKMQQADTDWKKGCANMGLTCLDVDDTRYERRYGMPARSDIIEDENLKKLERSKKEEDKLALDQVLIAQAAYDEKYADVERFKRLKTKCEQDTEKAMKEKVAKDQQKSGGSDGGGGKEPRKVDPEWKNGVINGQMVSIAHADSSRGSLLNLGPKGVRIGAVQAKRATAIDTPSLGYDDAYAQAEFFYDCSGRWDGEDCNGTPRPDIQHTVDKEEAMWHLRWRARLRRYTAPLEGAKRAITAADVAGLWKLDSAGLRTLSLKSALNAELRLELESLDPSTVELH